jgi:hypothetical protein
MSDKTLISQRHGGPYDRGSADSYYHRPRRPHYYEKGTSTSLRIEEADMTQNEIAEYNEGYDYNEQHGDKKDWGLG